MDKIKSKKPLYIPIKTLDSEDYVTGFGKLELAILLFTIVVTIVIGVIIAFLINSLTGIVAGVFLVSTVFVIIRRDNNNENMIRKIKIVIQHKRSQKKYLYSYDSNLDNIYDEV
ncbi:hypothetical protein SAMN05443270_3456 [Lacrimispora sphenoides]|uniref:hypothetical protein n=1 Tax=Lacrimispora sphenoides TaxID=29370 RepID=UPI0008CAAFF4|nr:hypothetical protein [Lacrimispora sphenoides]SEU22224.1 hypothetical protein SAMN05443270_3456 [Lacrimispora sphenoides]